MITMRPFTFLSSSFGASSLSVLASILSLFIASAALAQSNGSEDDAEQANKWYQIEVFIFANDNPSAGTMEHWRDDLSLKYPQRIISLSEMGFEPIDPTQLNAGNSDDSTPENIPFNAKTDDPLLRSYNLTGLPAQTSLTESGSNTEDDPAPQGLSHSEQPFIALPQDQMQLLDIAKRITGQKDFRLLFHKAWRQPITDREQSSSVLVRGGDQYDDHFELEGSVNISVERYLHIRTDLWLSSFKSAAGLEQLPWPLLPKLPITSAAQVPSVPAPSQQPLWSANSAGFNDFSYQSPFLDLRKRDYVVDRTVVLQQSRRMRSDELHYLDHPLMGLLVKVIPYEPVSDSEQTEETLSADGNGS